MAQERLDQSERPEGPEPAEQASQGSQTIPTCFWHPEVETGLSCSRCGKSICTQCLVQAPVGIRCRECGRVQPMPTYDVRPANYTRGIGVGALLMVVGAPLWVALDRFLLIFGAYGSVSGLLAIAFGYATGELISLAANRKRSPLLGLVAIFVVVATYLISRLFSPYGFGVMDVFFVGVGVFLAWQRLRR